MATRRVPLLALATAALVLLAACGGGSGEAGSPTTTTEVVSTTTAEPAATEEPTTSAPTTAPPPASTASTTASPTTVPLEPSPGTWATMPEGPLSPRSRAVTAWTGRELLLWRGEGNFSDACTLQQDGSEGRCGEQARNDGAVFNPATGRWRAIPAGPMPESTGSALTAQGAWTGSELVVWGLREGVGAAYDPRTDAWRSLPPAPITPRTRFSMAWTGSEVAIVGGYAYDAGGFPRPDPPVDGAAWNPQSGEWRMLPDLPRPRGGADLVAVGADLYLLGGSFLDGPATGEPPVGDMSVLRQSSPSWERGPAISGHRYRQVVDAGGSIVEIAFERTPFSEAAEPGSTRRFDPATQTWTTLPPLPANRSWTSQAVWTGREVVVLGGLEAWLDPDPTASPGFALDPAAGTWRELPGPPLDDISIRSAMSLAWTGTEVLVWGGELNFGLGSRALNTGVRYRPGR